MDPSGYSQARIALAKMKITQARLEIISFSVLHLGSEEKSRHLEELSRTIDDAVREVEDQIQNTLDENELRERARTATAMIDELGPMVQAAQVFAPGF